jgi:hypothetical protein
MGGYSFTVAKLTRRTNFAMTALSLLPHLSERQADGYWLNLVKRVFNPGDF